MNGGFLRTKASNEVDRDAEDEEDYDEDYEVPKPSGASLGEDEGPLDDMDRELLGEADAADEEEEQEYDEDEMDVN
jgi:hypothetical protein